MTAQRKRLDKTSHTPRKAGVRVKSNLKAGDCGCNGSCSGCKCNQNPTVTTDNSIV